MKSFKTFITERYRDWEKELMTTQELSDISAALSAATKAGQIAKKEWENLKYTLNKGIEGEGRHLWLSPRHRAWEDKFTKGRDLALIHWEALSKTKIYAVFSSYRNSATKMESLKKKIDAARKNKTKDGIYYDETIVSEWEAFYLKYADAAKMLNALKPKIVTVSMIRAEKKKKEVSAYNKMVDNSKVMIDALMDHMNEVKKSAGVDAGAHIDRVWKQIEKLDWDIKSEMIRKTFSGTNHILQTYLSVTDVDPKSKEKNKALGDSFRLDDRFRKKSPSKKKDYVNASMQRAEEDYRAFIAKMVGKIGGGVANAKAVGNPWSNSVLTVEMNDGTTQVWHTQTIVNYSKYGKPFYQFPSRQKK